MKKVIKVDTTLLEVKLRERGIILEKVKREGARLTAHLTLSEKDRLEKMALYRNQSVSQLVNHMIKVFQVGWGDLQFLHGYNKKGLGATIKDIFIPKEEKLYVTFDIDKGASDRVTLYRNKYEILRGVILTHMIRKYLKDNK